MAKGKTKPRKKAKGIPPELLGWPKVKCPACHLTFQCDPLLHLQFCSGRQHRCDACDEQAGWHYVTMMRGRMPRESHVQWATRVLGREIQFMDECTAGECETLKADLREAEKDGQRED
jgi:hypothetical protein